jgi:hypothetical protein
MAKAAATGYDPHAVLAQATLTRDALPYTEEFDALYAEHAPTGTTKHDFWRSLSNGAKRGGLKGKHRGAKAIKLSHGELDVLRTFLAGRFGKRDDLPYTDGFDHAVQQFNAKAKRSLSQSDAWRIVCNLAKQPPAHEVGLLLKQAVESLVIGIEHFNRPSERCRKTSVLLMLDHAFEMLLKAALGQRGVTLRKPDTGYALGIDECLNKATDDGDVRFLSVDERRTLAVLNGLRDQAQHHLVDVSEHILYTVAQSAVTLFAEVLARTFGQRLCDFVPSRVLPISTDPPREINGLMRDEYAQLRELLASAEKDGRLDEARLRSLVTIDRALQLEDPHLSDKALDEVRQSVKSSDDWTSVFAGIAQVKLSSDGVGAKVAIHLTKREGAPVRILVEGESIEGAAVVIRHVDDTHTYCFSSTELAKKVKLTPPKLLALITYLKLKDDKRCFKVLSLGKVRSNRYSSLALEQCRAALSGQSSVDMGDVWAKHRPQPRKPR